MTKTKQNNVKEECRMVLIDSSWNFSVGAQEMTFIADTKNDIDLSLTTHCAVGSSILVIDSGACYMKNTAGKFQRVGSTEVLG